MTAASPHSWFVTFALLLLPSAPSHGTEQVLPEGGAAAIEHAIPGARILVKGDIDEQNCGALPTNPGLVTGDFSGNNRVDFAALLRVRDTGKSIDWQGKTFKETELAFAIFMDDGNGTFKLVHIERYKDLTPAFAYIDLQPAGKVPGIGDKPSVTLRHPGISFVNCGKSEVIYYISRNAVRTHWVSD